ncbi:MAG: polysaccharide deacetylase family protein, partial [Bacillota bacterium]|nr:polysaccharide deacetylase family protein [Bacillota bacterium]
MSKRFIMRKTSAALSCLLFLFILSAAAQSHAIEPSTATPDAPGNTAISDNNGRPKPKDTKINHDKLYILTYHNLINDENPDSMNITVQKFLKDMKWLNENGYNTILPRELCNLKASNQNLSPKTVMIVLDDGYYSNYALAFPVLKEYNIKAAVMLVTSFIRSEAPSGSPRVAPLTWDDVREMSDNGLVEFGSHTNNLHSPEYKGN